MPGKYIPASGVIIDGNRVHIVNPGKVRQLNVAQGFYDATGFHPIRSSGDYDPDRAGDYYSQKETKRRKPKRKAKVTKRKKGR